MAISREYITEAGSAQQHDIPISGSAQISIQYGILTVNNSSNNNRTWSFTASGNLDNSGGKTYIQEFTYSIVDDGLTLSKSHTINISDGIGATASVNTFSDTTLVMGESATSKLNGSQGSDLISNRQIVVNGGVYNLASTINTTRGTFAISNPTANTTNFTFTPSATGTTTVQYRLTDTDGDVITSAGKSVNTSALIMPVATITNLSATTIQDDQQLTGKLSNSAGSYPLASQRMQIGSTWYTLTSNSLSTTYGTFTFSNRGTNSTSFVFTPSKTSTFGIKYRAYNTNGNYDDSPTTSITVEPSAISDSTNGWFEAATILNGYENGNHLGAYFGGMDDDNFTGFGTLDSLYSSQLETFLALRFNGGNRIQGINSIQTDITSPSRGKVSTVFSWISKNTTYVSRNSTMRSHIDALSRSNERFTIKLTAVG